MMKINHGIFIFFALNCILFADENISEPMLPRTLASQTTALRAQMSLFDAIENKNQARAEEMSAIILWSNSKLLEDLLRITDDTDPRKAAAESLLKQVYGVLNKEKYSFLKKPERVNVVPVEK